MTFRTPRRRISPRTRRRYRAIKDFFKKALGSASQPDIHINSSITDNVADLKHKIIGLEQQLSEVSKHCQDIIRLESTSSQRDSRTIISSGSKPRGSHGSRADDERQVETKLLYKTSESQYRNSEGSDCRLPSPNDGPNVTRTRTRPSNDYQTHSKTKKKKSKLDNRVNNLDINPSYSNYKTQHIPPCSTSSFHSLSDLNERRPITGNSFEKDRKYSKLEPNLRNLKHHNMYNERSQKNYETFERYYEERQKRQNRNKKKKHTKELDHDFIADIIKRQYRPIKLFGRNSELSQVSEPVCRDQEFRLNENIQEFRLNENIQEDCEWCSCCYGGGGQSKRPRPRLPHRVDHSDARSICDTRLYSSTRHPRLNHHRHDRHYDDTELYDLIPVKEYSSPKTKRKIMQENMAYDYYKEVPPSPRSHRPRLNLKAQYYTTSEDHIDFMRNPRNVSPKRHKKYQKILEAYDNDDMEGLQKKHGRRTKKHLQKIDKNQQIQEDNTTMTSLQYNTFVNEPKIIADTSLNKTQETELTEDKTDRALCEIKDILQNFLQEIKKEASSQSGKSDVSTKVTTIHNTQPSSGLTPDSGHSFNYSIPQCGSYLPAFPNPCCYPMMPVCPVNCMQNGYVVQSPSFTCGNCSKKLDETNNKSTLSNEANETDELIKEIYKFVAQSPKFSRKHDDLREGKMTSTEPRLTSRSAGGSTQVCRHDANVGTPKIRSYSKSCEAIGSRMISDYSGTNPSYSETILENVSLEATATTKSVSETESSADPSDKDKARKNKFASMLRSLGLFKKRKDTIEELNESDSSVDVELTRRVRGEGGAPSPYRQQVTDYAMYEQQYYRQPPMPAHYRHAEYVPERAPPYHPAVDDYRMPYAGEPCRHHGMPAPHSRPYYPGQPTAPPGPYATYDYNPPQLPLCLKEIEVKSTATQSERKLGFFRKMKKKVQQPAQAHFEEKRQRSFSTQTAQPPKPMFNWRTFKSKDSPKYDDPLTYSFKTQKKLVEGDMKMRNTMLKKMFHKRNPFSPRNMIIKTLLGRDKASFGDPPAMYKPRMFL